MKLKNKLLPLVGVSAVCATVAPIALTSCNGGGFVNCLDVYKATYTDIPTYDTWTTTKAQKNYLDQAAAHPAIFQDDFYWSQSMINRYVNEYSSSKKYKSTGNYQSSSVKSVEKVASEFIEMEVDTEERTYSGVFGDSINKDNEKISNISFKEFGGTIAFPTTFWTVSFDREIDWTLNETFSGTVTRANTIDNLLIDVSDLKAHVIDSKTNSKGKERDEYDSTVQVSGKISYTNVPIVLAYDSNYSLWWTYVDTSTTSSSGISGTEKWEYLWEKTDASISTNLNVSVDYSETEDGSTETAHNEYVYDMLMECSDDFDLSTELLSIDAKYGDGIYSSIVTAVTEFAFSHYLYNINCGDI